MVFYWEQTITVFHVTFELQNLLLFRANKAEHNVSSEFFAKRWYDGLGSYQMDT